jgi:hypothetical protein
VTNNEWSGMVEILLGLDADPYSYDDITDNSWPFKIRNRRKENKYIQFLTFSIRLLCLHKHFQELSLYSDDDTVRRYNFYYKFQELSLYSDDDTVRRYNFYYKFYSICEFIL